MDVRTPIHNETFTRTPIIIDGTKHNRIFIAAPVINSKFDIKLMMKAFQSKSLSSTLKSMRMNRRPIIMQPVRNGRQQQQVFFSDILSNGRSTQGTKENYNQKLLLVNWLESLHAILSQRTNLCSLFRLTTENIYRNAAQVFFFFWRCWSFFLLSE